ncbi:uncharacterized protein YndB with AHSA1/START domain [Homoserinimonas aerilata]|uniref:Uncharacterized protein YndB with AHSA1/START domain n=1 Tax=Homoserinimonas aerilata TaxID=1162970 RepID=A0A542YFE0_9MICO|nr:SRPBCC family protein [Homoserinimonas aerilata]TQL46780.1 uncharacterized protein YndB with AHSA1/START domain [Homoserinimonas aerilata]
MPVTDVTTDAEKLTMTLVADFAAPVERVWAAFTDPRQLERFWGPPGWPATFTEFDHTVGGRARYHMTSPQGERSSGAWEFLMIDEPRRFEVIDGFVDSDGAAADGMPSMRMTYEFEVTESGTRMINVTYFDSVEALEQLTAMGMVEGSTMAMNQLDIVLEGLRAYAQGKGTRTELLDDTHVRITRLIEGPREFVWRAHNEPELMRQWLLGPDGWVMTDCVIAAAAGDSYRTAWAPVDGTEGEAFGFEGEALLVEAPRRMVTTERMTGVDGPGTVNDLSLDEEDGATLLTLLIEYPSRELRDMILATGMTDGMEASYARMEKELVR